MDTRINEGDDGQPARGLPEFVRDGFPGHQRRLYLLSVVRVIMLCALWIVPIRAMLVSGLRTIPMVVGGLLYSYLATDWLLASNRVRVERDLAVFISECEDESDGREH
jgi:hypothetical protein